jgi:hypothetical protein
MNNSTKRKFVDGPPDKFGNIRTINLGTVSNIAFVKETDRHGVKRFKIIFNFATSISLKNDFTKIISEYSYFVYDNEEEYQEMIDKISVYTQDRLWLMPRVSGEIDRVINPEFISFISLDPRKNRVIVNLTTPVSFWSNNTRLTSDFMYLDFSTSDEFKTELLYMKDVLSVG